MYLYCIQKWILKLKNKKSTDFSSDIHKIIQSDRKPTQRPSRWPSKGVSKYLERQSPGFRLKCAFYTEVPTSLEDLDLFDAVLLHFCKANGQHAVFEHGFNFIFFNGYGKCDTTAKLAPVTFLNKIIFNVIFTAGR